MAQLFETLCMMLAFKESHSLAVHYCRLVWDVRSLSKYIKNFSDWRRHRGERSVGVMISPTQLLPAPNDKTKIFQTKI